MVQSDAQTDASFIHKLLLTRLRPLVIPPEAVFFFATWYLLDCVVQIDRAVISFFIFDLSVEALLFKIFTAPENFMFSVFLTFNIHV